PKVRENYRRLASLYAEKGGFGELARLFLWNIANARFAWRNRFLADEMRVRVSFDGGKITFDPGRLGLEAPATIEDLQGAVIANGSDGRVDVEALRKYVVEGLTDRPRFLRVAWQARMAEAQEV